MKLYELYEEKINKILGVKQGKILFIKTFVWSKCIHSRTEHYGPTGISRPFRVHLKKQLLKNWKINSITPEFYTNPPFH